MSAKLTKERRTRRVLVAEPLRYLAAGATSSVRQIVVEMDNTAVDASRHGSRYAVSPFVEFPV
jgi:hypothetical protein